MPNLKTHCAISKNRTGKSFTTLHEWIDEPKKKHGFNHRQERHFYNLKDKNYVKKRWEKELGKGYGEKAIVEWLFHIAIDNLQTAYKFSSKECSYGDSTYNYIVFSLHENGYIGCKCKRISADKLSN